MKCKDVGVWDCISRKEFITCMNHVMIPIQDCLLAEGLSGKLGLLAYWEIGLAGEPNWDA
jgi:hypothetical protein